MRDNAPVLMVDKIIKAYLLQTISYINIEKLNI